MLSCFLSWYRGLESKRIFTCAQGNFPTTVDQPIVESIKWQTDQLGEGKVNYIQVDKEENKFNQVKLTQVKLTKLSQINQMKS
jgi:hypothetical protein